MYKFFSLILLVIIIVACHRNPLDVDVSSIDITLNIKRLDQDIFQVTPDNMNITVPELSKKYGIFFNEYSENVIGIGNPADSLFPTYLDKFLTDSIRLLSRIKIDSVFSDIKGITENLENGFRHYNYYFPQKALPVVVTLMSGFNQSVIITEDAVGISLDNYLGTKCPFYVMLGLPEYKRDNMYKEKIPTDALYSWGISEFLFDDSQNNLLANMIYLGKMRYFLDAMFPEEPDYIKIGYRPEQIEWCIQNEAKMWTYLVEYRLLFSTDRMNIVRLCGPAPFTSVFTSESPGRTAEWLGWQIVRKYMKKNPKVSVQTLMNDNDYQKILNDSGYSPE